MEQKLKIKWRNNICLREYIQERKLTERKLANLEDAIMMNTGRVVNINQKDSPEAYREYQRLYQKLWIKKHPHYYRDLKRKKKEVQDMQKLEDLVSKFNEIQVNCLEVKYNTSALNEDKMKTLVEDFNKLMNDCIEELKNESGVKDAKE